MFAAKANVATELAVGTNRAVATSVAESTKGISWEALKSRAVAVSADLESGDRVRMSNAIKQIGETKIDNASLTSLKPAEYNAVIVGMTDKLRGVMSSSSADAETKLAAMKAYAKYASENSGGYKQGYLGRAASEELGTIYNDFSLSDDIRRIAFAEMQKVNEAMKGSMYAGIYSQKEFVSSAALRQQDTIGFLNRTKTELSSRESSAYYAVDSSFKGASGSVKREVFETLVSSGTIPKKYQGEYVSKMQLTNNNYLSELDRVGFKTTGSWKDKTLTYVNPTTGAQITVKQYQLGDRLPSYSADEIAKMKDVILRGGTFKSKDAASIPIQPGEKAAAELAKSSARAEAAAAVPPTAPAATAAIKGEPISHRDFGGMDANGGGSIIGQKVEIPFQPTNSSETLVKGTVVRSYQAGMDVATADGTIVRVNSNMGRIGTGTLTRSGPKFAELHGEKAMAVLKGPVDSGTFVIATVPQKAGGDFWRTEMVPISGFLSKEKLGRTEVAVITDAAGKKHYINPDMLGRNQNFIQLNVAKVKPEQVKDIRVTPESQITLYAVKESGSVKRARLSAEKKQAVVEAKENIPSYALFEQMRNQPGTALQTKMGYLPLAGDAPLPPGPILLLSPDKLNSLPKGTPVWSLMDGKRKVVGIDNLDTDTRGGHDGMGASSRPENVSAQRSIVALSLLCFGF